MRSPVVLINVFSVPKEVNEDEFLKKWLETAEKMKAQPGFIDTKLHSSLDENAEFRFINIAHWESDEAWQAAMSNVDIQEIKLPIKAHPNLYSVAVEY